MNISVRKEFSNITFQDLKPGDAFIATDKDSVIYNKGIFLRAENCTNKELDKNAVCLKNGELWHIGSTESVAKFAGSLEVPYDAFERGKKNEWN